MQPYRRVQYSAGRCSQRQRIVPWLLVVGVLYGALGSIAPVGAEVTPHFAVLTHGGLDRLEEDVTRLDELAEGKRLRTIWLQFMRVVGELPGFNRSGPISLAILFLPDSDAAPEPVLVLPVEDAAQFIAGVTDRFSLSIFNTGPGEWEQAGQVPIYLQAIEGYLLIGRQREHFSLLTPEHCRIWGERVVRDDFALVVSRSGIPVAQQERIWKQLQDQLFKKMNAWKEGQAEQSSPQKKWEQKTLALLNRFFADLHQGWDFWDFRLRFDETIAFSVDFRAMPDSPLARQLQRLALEEEPPLPPLAVDVPLQIDTAGRVPEPVREFVMELFQEFRHHLTAELSPILTKADRAPAAGAFEAMEQTVRSGRFQSSAILRESSPKHMALIVSFRVESAPLLQTSLDTILPYATDSEDLQEVEMRAIQQYGLVMHRLRGKKLRRDDRILYGEDASMFVGTSADRLWLSVGGAGTTPRVLEQVARFTNPQAPATSVPSETAVEDESPRSLPLMRFALSLPRWFPVLEAQAVERGQPDPNLNSLRKAFADDPEGPLQAELNVSAAGLRFELHTSPGYLKFLALQLQSAQ